MDPVALFLLTVAGIFLVGAVGEMIFERTNIPDVIWLIVAGVLLGPVSGWVTRAELNVVAPYFAALTLVVILFEGGSRIRLKELRSVAPRAALLAVLTFALAVGGLALATKAAAGLGLLPATWTWSHGLLVGCILGGPSSIIVMPAMARAKLPPALANLVGLESAITDAFCVVGTTALINLMVGGSDAEGPGVTLLKSLGLGLLIGTVVGFAWLVFLRLLKNNEHAYPITLAILLMLYVAIDAAGGSAALGILTVAIILGNASSISKTFALGDGLELGSDVRGFHSRMAFIIKSFFFTFMGLMLGPPWSLLALGFVLGAIVVGLRLPGAFLATAGSTLDRPSRRIVMLSMPRGMAAGVLATLPYFAGVPDTEALPVFVFAAVVTTILVFAVGFPIIKAKMEAVAVLEVAATPVPAEAASPVVGPAAGSSVQPAQAPSLPYGESEGEAPPSPLPSSPAAPPTADRGEHE